MEKQSIKNGETSRQNNRNKYPDLAKLMDRLRQVFKEAKVKTLKERK